VIEGKTDAQRWETTRQALELLQVKDERLKTLMRAVCVVLQLGNLIFQADKEDDEKSVVESREELESLADLMGVPLEALEKALLFRTVVAGKESYTVPLKVERARDGCDAFAKEIYQQAFDWLVRQINSVTCAEENYVDAHEVEEYGKIGLLDIFGFESFDVNRFEQVRDVCMEVAAVL
jgi:myosin-5